LYSDQHVERLKKIINVRDVLGYSLQELQEFISISEEINNQRLEVRQTEDIELKLEKITEMEQTVEKQLSIINLKLEKLTLIRTEFRQLYERILEAKTKYNQQ
jgi:MerR family transcriptional regulator, repressor of the yfmOP operon